MVPVGVASQMPAILLGVPVSLVWVLGEYCSTAPTEDVNSRYSGQHTTEALDVRPIFSSSFENTPEKLIWALSRWQK